LERDILIVAQRLAQTEVDAFFVWNFIDIKNYWEKILLENTLMKTQIVLKKEREKNICQYGEENNKLYTVNVYMCFFFSENDNKKFFLFLNNINAEKKIFFFFT
jgi:hypothetical protein